MVDRIVGFMEPERFAARLRAALEKGGLKD